MKKILTLTALLALSTSAFAGFTGGNQAQGGFVGATAQTATMTVAQALKAKDDTHVTLTGKISSRIDNDEFMFQDNTGSIKIEVEDEAWQGQEVSDKDTITIKGKIDRSKRGKKVEVEVYQLQKH